MCDTESPLDYKLKFCDVCHRSELSPIISGRDTEPLEIRFDEARQIMICEECEACTDSTPAAR